MTLKEAVVRVASVECAFETLEDDYKRASAMIEAASADELSVVYIDLVRRDDTRHCVSRIGRWAGKLPFSTALLDAFRERRDGFVEDRGNLLATFEYCEKFGGTSDLKWMQATVEKFGKDYPRWEADEAIKKLRRRLAEQEQGQ